MNHPRGAQRYQLTLRDDEDALIRAIVELASQYGRMATAGSQRCRSGTAGRFAKIEWSAYGVAALV